MKEDSEHFKNYLRGKHIFTLAVSREDGTYSVPLFYDFHEDTMSLIFMSDENTNHGRALSKKSSCSGAIFNDVRDIKQIKGIQMLGHVQKMSDAAGEDLEKSCSESYYKKFPEAEKLSGQFYIFRIAWMKLTDNSVKFGYKREWNSDIFS